MFQIKMDKWAKYEEQFHFLKKELPKELEQFLLDTAKSLWRMTKNRTPKEHGDLRSAWKIGNIERKGDDLIIMVYNDKDYAMHVEYGHKVVLNIHGEKETVGKADGFYMMRVSVRRIKRQIPRRLKKHFDKVLNSL